MFRTLIVTLLLVSVGSFINAQEESAHLRIMNLSFIPQVSSTVDVSIDATVVFDGLSFPFSTPYVELLPGEHQLTTSIIDDDDASATTTVTLESDHHYVLIVEGDYREDMVQFLLIDETDLPLAETGNVAIIANLTPSEIDFNIDEILTLENLEHGTAQIIAVKDEMFSMVITPSGEPDTIAYSMNMNGVSSDVTLIAVRENEDDLQIIFDHFTRLKIAEYILSLEGVAPFSDALSHQLDIASSLAENGAYTMFLPTINAINTFDAIPNETEALEQLIANHITLADIPPYELPNNQTLTMLNDTVTSLQFMDTNSGYWEIEDVPISSNIRLADGVIYIIDGIITP